MIPKPTVVPRDVSPILQRIRELLLGRPHTTALRFEQFVATRSPPPPVIPDGPCHELSANYYCNRDVRREVQPPTSIPAMKPQIEAGTETSAVSTARLPTPGKVYNWD